MTEALYLPDGDLFVPTELTAGPWEAGVQHGGPPAALLAGAVEQVPTEAPMRVVRLTVELLRRVPIGPLHVTTDTLRRGRRVQLASASLHHDGAEVARATALSIRTGDVTLPDLPAEPPPPPDAGHHPQRLPAGGYVTDAVDVRFLHSDFSEPGPGTAWFRLRGPVVAGEEPSPLQRVAAAADFGNGISAELKVRTHLYVNPDLTIYLRRHPRGEWVCLDSVTLLDDAGSGIADTVIYDLRGRIGRSVQALYVADR